MKITTKIVVLVLLLQFLTILVFSYFNEIYQEKRELANMDDRLLSVAHAANDFIFQEYHDRIVDENSISKEEYIELVVRLTSFSDKANVKYVNALVKRDSDFFYTATSATRSEFEANNYELFFESILKQHQNL